MTCIMYLDHKTYLDARKHSVLALNINHSCSFDFYVTKWKVQGNYLLVIFAKHNIKLGEDLVLDY